VKNLIREDELYKHKIEKYHFIQLDNISKKPVSEKKEEKEIGNTVQESLFETDNKPVESTDDNSKTVEELLKKIEELSSTIVELQMQNEKLLEEFEEKLQKEKDIIYEEVKKESLEETKKDFEKQSEELQKKYLSSIEELEKSIKNINEFYKKAEDELPKSAFEIAKEVIAKEIEENPQKVALSLSENLIKELENATKITIKVNSNDFNYIKEHFNSDSVIEVLSDDTVEQGGVIILSDVGNIDGTVSQRLENIKKLLFSS